MLFLKKNWHSHTLLVDKFRDMSANTVDQAGGKRKYGLQRLCEEFNSQFLRNRSY